MARDVVEDVVKENHVNIRNNLHFISNECKYYRKILTCSAIFLHNDSRWDILR